MTNLGFLVERVGKASPKPVEVAVITADPDRRLLLRVSTHGAALEVAGDIPDSHREVHLPAEAFVR